MSPKVHLQAGRSFRQDGAQSEAEAPSSYLKALCGPCWVVVVPEYIDIYPPCLAITLFVCKGELSPSDCIVLTRTQHRGLRFLGMEHSYSSISCCA